MRETAMKTKQTKLDNLLSLMGMRMIDGQIAEIPEKIPEEQRSNHDRRTIINTVQNIH